VKVLDLEAIASSEHRARFELEARAAAEIRSAHVVQILDHGVFEGRPYIVMEHLRGEDLGARLTRDRVLDARATAAIITQAARARQAQHRARGVCAHPP
jgi:serine/threonine-protein kinase